MRCIVNRPDLRIYQGNADEWDSSIPVDFIFTNPYGFMPRILSQTPALVHHWAHRKADAERWSHMQLSYPVGFWNEGREVFWANRFVVPQTAVDISMFRPEPGGWYPEDLVRTLLPHFVKAGQTVWDGFMGRGTVGKVCLEMGINYIGIEQLEGHLALALDYLGIEK